MPVELVGAIQSLLAVTMVVIIAPATMRAQLEQADTLTGERVALLRKLA